MNWQVAAIPAIPAISAAFLAVLGSSIPKKWIGTIASAAVLLSLLLGLSQYSAVMALGHIDFKAGAWLATHSFQAAWGLHLDSIAFAMVLLVTGFGFLITLYSIGYMADDAEPVRFFASLNLFVASMLILILADNLVLIFLGWEGVGLCSYLLIGHYWKDQGVPLAAYRAFFTNRIGDILFILGVFYLFRALGTFSISDLASAAPTIAGETKVLVGRGLLLLLGGAFAKSAQAPLHVWLPDAMAGPTPVSALIHAATMVTAGVYLCVRLMPLFTLFPEVRTVILLCALVTLIVGAVLAAVQFDIKKILAYSTLSNLALMFLAIASASSGAAMMHLFGHASFKALLFLGAGSIIASAHHEQDIRKLAGVLRKMPITRIAFWVGTVGATGLIPWLSAGFFSKELVLESLAHTEFQLAGMHFSGHVIKWIVLAMELLSVVYMVRLLAYLESDQAGEALHHGHIEEKSVTIKLVLALLIPIGPIFGIFSATEHFGSMGRGVYALITGRLGFPEGPTWSEFIPAALVGLMVAILIWVFFSNADKRESLLKKLSGLSLGQNGPLSRLFYFDDVYNSILLTPLRILGRVCSVVFESISAGFWILAGYAGDFLSQLFRRPITGKLHHYAMILLLAALSLLLLIPGN